MSKPRVTVITFPISESANVALTHLVEVVKQSSSEMHVITGGGGYDLLKVSSGIDVRKVESKPSKGYVRRALGYIRTQLSISRYVMLLAPHTDTFLFFIGGPDQVLPVITAKLVRKKIVISFAGSSVQTYAVMLGRGSKISAAVLDAFQVITCSLADKLVVYSEKLVRDWNLKGWKDKISIAHEHYISFDGSGTDKIPSERPMLVGYVGRLSEEKGVLNLITAMDILARKRNDLHLTVIGEGLMRKRVSKYIQDHDLESCITLVGAVPHRNLPDYLKQFRLLVIPSYTEGLPNVMIEAMSCGTPVLATTAGGIPDFIVEGETGFLMESNAPPCISKEIQKAVESPRLDLVAAQALEMVRREFTYASAVEKYSEVLNDVAERSSTSIREKGVRF